MGKLKNVLVIASGSSIAELTCGAAQLGETVTLIYYGERDSAVNADRAIYIENIHGEDSIVMFAGGIADIALGAAPDLVIMDSSKNSRLIAAYICLLYTSWTMATRFASARTRSTRTATPARPLPGWA